MSCKQCELTTHSFFQEAQNPTLHLCFCIPVLRDMSWVSLRRIPEAEQERGGAVNGKTQEKLDVSCKAIGFPWGFTQPRPNSALSYICNT